MKDNNIEEYLKRHFNYEGHGSLILIEDEVRDLIKELESLKKEHKKELKMGINDGYAYGLTAYMGKLPNNAKEAIEESNKIDDEILSELYKEYNLY